MLVESDFRINENHYLPLSAYSLKLKYLNMKIQNVSLKDYYGDKLVSCDLVSYTKHRKSDFYMKKIYWKVNLPVAYSAVEALSENKPSL